ncbi:Uncharacterised protein [Mycobacteroides abscessus subsp. abscessus]|nr:Uncharacterised protein [Mycobacteroides abscessus subsp. abscessus]
MLIIRRSSGRVCGSKDSCQVLAPPAEVPTRVMFFGSPPNALALSLTQCNRAIWSCRPQLVCSPVVGSSRAG